MKKTDTRHTRKWAERRLARLASRILVNQWIPFLTCILKTQEEETTTNFKNIVPPSFLRRVRQNGPLQSASLEYPEGNHPLSFHVWTCTGKLGTWTERSMWGKARQGEIAALEGMQRECADEPRLLLKVFRVVVKPPSSLALRFSSKGKWKAMWHKDQGR